MISRSCARRIVQVDSPKSVSGMVHILHTYPLLICARRVRAFGASTVFGSPAQRCSAEKPNRLLVLTQDCLRDSTMGKPLPRR
jgi:hypothetical protein